MVKEMNKEFFNSFSPSPSLLQPLDNKNRTSHHLSKRKKKSIMIIKEKNTFQVASIQFCSSYDSRVSLQVLRGGTRENNFTALNCLGIFRILRKTIMCNLIKNIVPIIDFLIDKVFSL